MENTADSAAKGRQASSSPGNTSNAPGVLAVALGAAPKRSNSQSSLHKVTHGHRQSFAENQRHPPPSPRAQRHPSFTQAAVQELLNHPPVNRQTNPRFVGRDWRDVTLGELSIPAEVKWADLSTSVEDATMTLLKSNPNNVVLVRETPESKTAISTFDHSDLNAYLVVVVGLAKPEDEHVELYKELSEKAQCQTAISLGEIQPICRKEAPTSLPVDARLDKAMEILGGGIHRILVTSPTSEVVGVLSQLHLVEFFWNEGVNFPAIDRLYGAIIRDLQIGTQQVIAINADSPLCDALSLMNNEGLTSVAVVDNGLNVVGNISAADVRHLTNAAALPLLKLSCMHFITVILSERGMEKGRDSFPVFYVNPYSTLAHTIAKLVATQSHRMWVVEPASPSPSQPVTPLPQPINPLSVAPTSAPSTSAQPTGTLAPAVIIPPTGATSAPQSPLLGQSFATVPASAFPGAHLSGRLTGVVSLTDILNLFARSSGLNPSDPAEARSRRRRSSSSSVRPSIDSARPSFDFRR